MGFEKGNKLGRKFQPGVRPPGAGRRRKLKNIPENARDKVYAALYHVLTLPDKAAAEEYLKQTAKELPEYGNLIQVYTRGLLGNNGALVAEQILDRLFGKPTQSTDIKVGTEGPSIQVTVGSPEAAAGLQNALKNGAQPAQPKTDD